MSSVSKYSKLKVDYKTIKNDIWTLEYALRVSIKFVLSIAFFFIILYSYSFYIDITQDYMIYFLYVFMDYVISGFLAWFFSYIIVKLMFWFNNRPVTPFTHLIRNKMRTSRLWIMVFTTIFQSFAFIFSIQFKLTEWLPINNYFASLIMSWLVVKIASWLLGRGLFLLFRVV